MIKVSTFAVIFLGFTAAVLAFTENAELVFAGRYGQNWTRADCQKVAKAWLEGKVLYNWTPNTKQYVKSGKGLYRADCSGFVSAAWDVDPQKDGGYATSNIPVVNITVSQLQICDALLRRGRPGHIALFWGWSGKTPIVVEECGHTKSCCTQGYTCPGKCGSAENCDEYCDGCPIQHRPWPNGIPSNMFPVRRPGW